jgi:hypothetical protein
VCERDHEITQLMSQLDESQALWVCIQTFVSHERVLRDSLGKGGQSCGDSPSMTVTTLRTLERLIRDAPEVSQRYCDEIARLIAERDKARYVLDCERAARQLREDELTAETCDLTARVDLAQQERDALRRQVAQLLALARCQQWLVMGLEPDSDGSRGGPVDMVLADVERALAKETP